jgi:RNA polymerase sigma factor (sigma-70 family)
MAHEQLTAFLDRLRDSALRQDGAGLTDGQLLDRFIASREEAAFEALVRRHGRMVLGVCWRILRNDADAEDAFQAIFLVLATKASSVRPRTMVGNWLHGVAYRTALKAKAMRLRRTKKEREAGMLKPDALDETQRELLALLDQELSGLPQKYRAPIILCDLEGKTIREAARQLRLPQGTTATRLARGRALLARRLARCGVSVSVAGLAPTLAQAAVSGAVPTRLIVSTVEAVMSVVAGQATAAVLISTKVAALKEGMLKAMLLMKLKTAGTVLLLVTLLGSGGILLTHRTLGADPQAPPSDGPLAAAPQDKEKKDKKEKSDKELLQGTWVEESRGADGKKVAESDRWKLVFDEDKVTWTDRGKDREGTFTVDPDRKPKEIDLTLANPSLVLNGIYELKNDTLKTLWRENDRGGLPNTLDPKQGVLIVLKKKKAE